MADAATALPTAPLLTRLDNGIFRLTLNKPERMNALSEATMAALSRALDVAASDPAVRVVVIEALPGKVFCAGHDLKELNAHRADPDRGRAYYHRIMTTCSALMQQIVNLPKPVIAAVEGVATAAGCQLVASCDLAVATDRATFCTPGVNIGLFCSTPMVALSRNVGRKQAMEMLLTGESIDAATAREYGLINRIVPSEYLEMMVTRYAALVASKSPLTLKIGKQAFHSQIDMPLAEAYAHCAEVMVENMLARDAEEGIDAFLGKRAPEWTGA